MGLALPAWRAGDAGATAAQAARRVRAEPVLRCLLALARLLAGGVEGIKATASQLIAAHELDDTFYVMDLANVVRLYKV